MDVEIQRRAKALHDGDRSAATVGDAGPPGPAPQEPEHRAQENGHDGPAEVMVPGQEVADTERQAQHPLPYGDGWKDVVHHVRRVLGHPSCAAARTEAPPFAREGDQPVGAACGAPKPRKPACQPAAAQIRPKLLVNESRQAFPISDAGRLSAKRLEMIPNHPIQHALLGTPRPVAVRRAGHAAHGAGPVPRDRCPFPPAIGQLAHLRRCAWQIPHKFGDL